MVTAASALPFPWSLNHYQHTAFTKKDGAPQSANELAETSDGYLWTNSSSGLVRFDGHQFQPFSPRPGEKLISDQVRFMFAPKTGGLWVSYDNIAGVSFINHGHVTNYDDKGEWRPGSSAMFLHDRQGNVMAYAFPRIMKFIGGKWKKVDDDPGTQNIYRVTQDASFNIWALTGSGDVLVMREGESRFKEAGIKVNGGYSISTGGDHDVFVSSHDHMIHRFNDSGDHLSEVGRPVPYYARYVTVDRSGNVWVGTANDGVHFLGPLSNLPVGDRPFPVDEKLDHSEGLTGNFASVFQDNEGDIWVATENGLDRFMPSAFSQLILPSGITMISITPGHAGDVWIGSDDFKVIHYLDDKATLTDVPSAALTGFADRTDGTVFISTIDQLWQLAPGDPIRIATLPATGEGVVKAITRDSTGKLWLSFRSHTMPLATLSGETWEKIDGADSPFSMVTDSQGVIWGGLPNNRLVSINRGAIRQYSDRDGLSVGTIKVIVPHDGQLWLGGDRGLQVLVGSAFKVLKLAGTLQLDHISGLVFDEDGNLWVHTLTGLFRIDGDDVRRLVADAAFATPYRLFDSDDGVPGIPAQTFTLPTLKLGNDGRIWIAGQAEAAWMDPRDVPAELPVGRPVIERIFDGKDDYDLSVGALRLPENARNLQISYTTPELTFPSRVRFQYRLIGFDDGWQEAGDRRQAFYSHLTAGNYIFAVRSKTSGHTWGEPSSISFIIAPKFFETWWFRLAVVCFVLALLWIFVLWQIRLATSRVRNRMQIRVDEREAIARDLHDTLLQSTQALVVQLGVLANEVNEPNLKRQLEFLAGTSKDAVEEGRDKVSLLRSQSTSSDCQVTRLVRFGMGLSNQYGVQFKTEVNGSPQSLSQIANDELVPIVKELLINAFRHAKASHVSTTLSYGFWRFVVTVSDDGIGIDKAIVVTGAPEGHWGIRGVKERVARIGGRVTFRRLNPRGTKIVVNVSSRRAYAIHEKSRMGRHES